MNIPPDFNKQLSYYASLWNLELGERQIETPSSVVAFGRQGQTPIVLKLVKPDSDEYPAGRWLQFHSGRGAVALLDSDRQAFLLEKAVPGTELVELVRQDRDEEAVKILCQTIANLHGETSRLPGGFRTVEDWGRAFERNSRELLTAKIPVELLNRAYDLYRELCATQGPRRLLHGDLHHYNVLQNGARGWRTIDPKGVIGELAYETGAMLRNPIEMPELYTNPITLKNRVKTICRELNLEEGRVLGWCFAQAILSAVWTIEDGSSDEQLKPTLRLAEAALSLLQNENWPE